MDYNKPANWASQSVRGAALASLQTCSAPNAAGSRDLPLFLTQHASALFCGCVFPQSGPPHTRATRNCEFIPPQRERIKLETSVSARARVKNEFIYQKSCELFAYFVASAQMIIRVGRRRFISIEWDVCFSARKKRESWHCNYCNITAYQSLAKREYTWFSDGQ